MAVFTFKMSTLSSLVTKLGFRLGYQQSGEKDAVTLFYAHIQRGAYLKIDKTPKSLGGELFLIHSNTNMALRDHSLADFFYEFKDGEFLLPELEDPLTDDQIFNSLADGTYQPLIDEREPVWGSYLALKPREHWETKTSAETGLSESLFQIFQIFFSSLSEIKILSHHFDFDQYNSRVFTRFLVGNEPLESKARERYELIKLK